MKLPLAVGERSRLQLGLIIVASLLALYAVVGFLVLPVVLKRVLIGSLHDALAAEVRLAELSLNPFLLTVAAEGFELDAEDGSRVAAFDRLFIDLELASLVNRAITLREISLEGAHVDSVIDEAGLLNLTQLVRAQDEPPAPEQAPAEESEAESPLPPIIIEQLRLAGASATFSDLSSDPPLRLGFLPIDLELASLHLGDVSLGASREGERGAPLDFSLELEGGGRLGVVGELATQPPHANLAITIDGFQLAQLQPLLASFARAELRSGALSIDARLRYDSTAAAPLEVAGTAGLRDVVIHDTAEDEDLLRLGSVEFVQVEVRMTPLEVQIDRITLREPYLRFAIDEQGITNFQHALIPGDAAGSEADTSPAPEAAEDEADEGAASTFAIGTIALERGSAFFADLSLRPPFATGIEQLEGGLEGLASDANSRAAVKLAGRTGPHAPVSIEGMLQLFSPRPALDLDLVFRNLDLTAFSPYSGRFAGYRIARGRMDMDLAYMLEGSRLHGENVILIDQLTLGERIESPDALTLPVALGIALLKDAKGRIDLDLEVQGDVDDPEFTVAGLLWKTFVNLLTKAVTQPFNLLGSAMGGEAPPDRVVFEPGVASLGATQASDLKRLAEALASRPALLLQVQGAASPRLDAPPLALQRLEEQLVAIHFEGKKSDDRPRLLTLEQRADAIEDLHRRRSKAGQLAPLAVAADSDQREGDERKLSRAEKKAQRLAQLEAELLASIEVGAGELGALARQRAESVLAFLVEVGGIDQGRVSLRDATLNEEQNPAVRLALDARS